MKENPQQLMYPGDLILLGEGGQLAPTPLIFSTNRKSMIKSIKSVYAGSTLARVPPEGNRSITASRLWKKLGTGSLERPDSVE